MTPPTPPAESAPAHTVYYNSACPVCKSGIAAQQALMGRAAQCELMWVDVHAEPESAKALGLTLDSVRQRLVVTDSAGRPLQGYDAIVTLWEHTPGFRLLARLAKLAGVRWLGQRVYNRFALHLYAWNVRKGRWRPLKLENSAKRP